MRRFMVIAIPIVTLTLFVLIMLSNNFLKRPLGENDNIPKQIQIIEGHIDSGKWEEVSKQTDELEQIWQRVVKRVQFSGERDEINGFNMSIVRLRGAIMAQDKANAFIELSEAHEHWKQIGK